METVNCAPTVEGYRHMKKIFEQTIQSAESKIVLCESVLDGEVEVKDLDEDLVVAALELLVADEKKRIATMREGILEVEKGIPK